MSHFAFGTKRHVDIFHRYIQCDPYMLKIHTYLIHMEILTLPLCGWLKSQNHNLLKNNLKYLWKWGLSFIYTVANVAVKRGVPVVCKKYDSLIFVVCLKGFTLSERCWYVTKGNLSIKCFDFKIIIFSDRIHMGRGNIICQKEPILQKVFTEGKTI